MTDEPMRFDDEGTYLDPKYDIPRDPLAALDEALRRWSFVHEDDFDPSSERVHAAWLAASVTLDARPSGDNLWECAVCHRQIAESARAAHEMANPGHGWIDVERLAPNTGNDPRFKWYRRTEDDATLFGRLIGLAESATLDARPSGDEALRDEFIAAFDDVAKTIEPFDIRGLNVKWDRLRAAALALAAPVSPSPAMQTRAVPDGPIIKNATVTSLAPVSPSPAPETTFDPVTMKYPPRESVDAARLLSAHELLLRELDVLLHADIDPHIKEHVETAIRWANEAPVSPSNPDDQMGSVPGRPGDTFRLNKPQEAPVFPSPDVDRETIIDALQVAASYPAEMQVNRDRWNKLRERLESGS